MADQEATGAGASNFSEMQSGNKMSRIVGSSVEFYGETDSAGFVGTKEIQTESPQEGKVLGGVAQANLTRIFPKGYVDTPVQAILDTPVRSDLGACFSMLLSIIGGYA